MCQHITSCIKKLFLIIKLKPQNLNYLYTVRVHVWIELKSAFFYIHTCNMHTVWCTRVHYHTRTPPSPLSARSFSPRTARGHETP